MTWRLVRHKECESPFRESQLRSIWMGSRSRNRHPVALLPGSNVAITGSKCAIRVEKLFTTRWFVAGKIECYRLDETTAYVGVVIKPAHRRNGYAKKALGLLCKAERERSAGVRLKAEIYADNPGSMQFFEACGFRRTGAVTEEIFRGQPRMLYEYEYRG